MAISPKGWQHGLEAIPITIAPGLHPNRWGDPSRILTAYCRRLRTCETIDVKSMLDIRAFGNIVTVHLKTHPSAPKDTTLTKFEVERIVDGQPPFYRSTISIPGSRTIHLKHPFNKNHHSSISRGGWVLAVGLSVGNDYIPCLYNMQQLRQKNSDEYWKGTLVWSAFEMIGHTLEQLRAFYHSPGVILDVKSGVLYCDQALDCYYLMVKSDWSLRPHELKTKDIESKALFRSLVGLAVEVRVLGKMQPKIFQLTSAKQLSRFLTASLTQKKTSRSFLQYCWKYYKVSSWACVKWSSTSQIQVSSLSCPRSLQISDPFI
ncbi:hypothetical protein D0Z07_2309 [Hyphodiscus hymeniophilus]|uniref:Uncharacterized protein n=1 Tax=Hyphodiscus hymeniophilus TaxID=353542 RepID=A0A9P6VMJ6_9HELO|nr:hypothetical protein D0Z07_2309 [Hyphodiscus hymeniophilus]